MPHAQSVTTTTTPTRRRRDRTPVLITEAPPSPAEQFAARRRRYSLIMGMRIPCLVAAGVLAIGFGLTGLAAVLVIASVPLPWIAVLIANDAPPKKSEKVARAVPTVGTTTSRVLGAQFIVDAPRDDAA